MKRLYSFPGIWHLALQQQARTAACRSLADADARTKRNAEHDETDGPSTSPSFELGHKCVCTLIVTRLMLETQGQDEYKRNTYLRMPDQEEDTDDAKEDDRDTEENHKAERRAAHGFGPPTAPLGPPALDPAPRPIAAVPLPMRASPAKKRLHSSVFGCCCCCCTAARSSRRPVTPLMPSEALISREKKTGAESTHDRVVGPLRKEEYNPSRDKDE